MKELEGGEAGGEGLSHVVSSQLGIASPSSWEACCSRSFSNTGLYFTMFPGVQDVNVID